MTVRLRVDGAIETDHYLLPHRSVHKVTGGMALALSMDRGFRESTIFDHFGRLAYVILKEGGREEDMEFVAQMREDKEWHYVVSSLLMASYLMAGMPKNPVLHYMTLSYEHEVTVIDEQEIFNEQHQHLTSDERGEAAHDAHPDHPERGEGGPERSA